MLIKKDKKDIEVIVEKVLEKILHQQQERSQKFLNDIRTHSNGDDVNNKYQQFKKKVLTTILNG